MSLATAVWLDWLRQNGCRGLPALDLVGVTDPWEEVDMSTERPIALPDGRVFHSDPKILGGTPVFVGTRVPVRSLIEYLEGGHSLDEYLDSFPTVRREQAIGFLQEAARALLGKVA